MTETTTPGSSSSLSKVELSIADGSKTTIGQLAKDLMPLLIVVLKADTTLCNKQLKAISDLEEEGVFANKCTPIAVLLGTLNEIENWESKMKLKYTIVQGTPEFMEQLGCASRGKAKRACVLLGGDDHVEFIDTAIKSGVSFIPKLKEYLATVPAIKAPAKTAANRGGKKTASKKANQSLADAAAAASVEQAVVETGKGALKLKVTRKSLSNTITATSAVEKKKASAKTTNASTVPAVVSKKSLATVKKAVSKKRATSGKATTPSAVVTNTPEIDQSAAAVSTSTPADESLSADPSKAANKPPPRATKSKRRSSEPTSSDIESPAAQVVNETATQSRQRKRIKITS